MMLSQFLPRICRRGIFWLGLSLLSSTSPNAQMSMPMPPLPMSHGAGNNECLEPALACASTVSPTFAPDGTIWLTFDANNKIFVVHSSDNGQSFSSPIAVTRDPVKLDNGPDERPVIAVDHEGRVFIAYAIFKDNKYNGEVFFSRSIDGGKTFSLPRPLVDNTASQRFQTLTIDPLGNLFAAWLDKRGVVAAAQQGKTYAGAALAYSWSSDGGASFSPSRIAHHNTCECCRLGVAFAGPGRPAVLFRNVFDGTVRDHAVITFTNANTPGAPERVSVDDWKIDACPHQGPSLALSASGTYHATWFTDGDNRKGLFYARSTDGGRHFSKPMILGNPDHDLSRTYVTALPGAVWVSWKDFDGDEASVNVIFSQDDGNSWSDPRVVAKTTDASDHPLLLNDGHRAWVSWMTKADGYRLFPLETVP
jgi:hypothetical protein